MAPSHSPDTPLAGPDAALLLDIADAAIVDGLAGLSPVAPDEAALPPALRERRGVFVTLTVGGTLNGCIGGIQGVEPLGHGAARHAWAAAFGDPRLPALRSSDYDRLTIEVSVLSELTALRATSRNALLDTIRPGIDGLLISAGGRQGVFLPAVWKELPHPSQFLDHLHLKAGLPPGIEVPGIRVWRFTAERFSRRAGEQRPNPLQAA